MRMFCSNPYSVSLHCIEKPKPQPKPRVSRSLQELSFGCSAFQIEFRAKFAETPYQGAYIVVHFKQNEHPSSLFKSSKTKTSVLGRSGPQQHGRVMRYIVLNAKLRVTNNMEGEAHQSNPLVKSEISAEFTFSVVPSGGYN